MSFFCLTAHLTGTQLFLWPPHKPEQRHNGNHANKGMYDSHAVMCIGKEGTLYYVSAVNMVV